MSNLRASSSSMLVHLRRAFTFLVAPPTCAFCKIFIADDTVVCDECRSRIMPIVSHEIVVTPTYSLKVIAVSPYQDPLRSLILAKNRSSLVASTQLGMLIWQMSSIKTIPLDCFIPIPLHWTRFAKRGFNQAHEIARVLSEQSGKPVMPVLKRVKRTQFQAALAHDERSENVADAFSFCGKPE